MEKCKCRNDALLAGITLNKLTKYDEVAIALRTELDECRMINSRDYIFPTTRLTYKRYDIPDNAFACLEGCCENTGTVTAGQDALVYKIREDARKFAAGIITFYVKGEVSEGTFRISSESNFTNADSYTFSTAGAIADTKGFKAVVIDLSQNPTTVGNGWTPVNTCAYIEITVPRGVGVSSINVLDSIEDLENNDVVILRCLSGIEGTEDLEAAESRCLAGEYNTEDEPELTRTVTAGIVTPNYWKLNPLLKKGKRAYGFTRNTQKLTVEASANALVGSAIVGQAQLGSKSYGVVKIADKMPEECRFLSVAVDDNCHPTEGELNRVSTTTPVVISEKQYFVLESGGDAVIFLHENLVGLDVIVTYPKMVEIEEQVANMDNVNRVRASMFYKSCQNDGEQINYLFDHVLITSFPATINTDATEFALTFTIKKGRDGHLYHRQRVINHYPSEYSDER